jgi:hypothetical protein
MNGVDERRCFLVMILFINFIRRADRDNFDSPLRGRRREYRFTIIDATRTSLRLFRQQNLTRALRASQNVHPNSVKLRGGFDIPRSRDGE